ncbi:MAG: translation initiation factor IF-3 [Cytophagales bacterium]|nr:translation initiation factor IF-3 [Cytophagales bacterium]MDW8385316.1 translation initiation factor IF-3 [Flammeovirgaceae bacterium]
MKNYFNKNNSPSHEDDEFESTNFPIKNSVNSHQSRHSRKEENEPYRINHRINTPEVRLVGENVKNGIYPLEEALRIAEEQGLDLVEISPNANPPVCKVIDYSKFKYEQKKKQKELKAKTHKTVVKELRFGPNTDDHDLDFKIRHAINFLKEGNKVRAYVQFVGRSISYMEQGEEILNRFVAGISEVGKIEQGITKEGRKMSILVTPKTAADLKAESKK